MPLFGNVEPWREKTGRFLAKTSSPVLRSRRGEGWGDAKFDRYAAALAPLRGSPIRLSVGLMRPTGQGHLRTCLTQIRIRRSKESPTG